MNHIQVFLNVNLKILNDVAQKKKKDAEGELSLSPKRTEGQLSKGERLANGLLWAGNAFLTPCRFIFSGKAVQMQVLEGRLLSEQIQVDDKNEKASKNYVPSDFAKVSSFFKEDASITNDYSAPVRSGEVKYSKQTPEGVSPRLESFNYRGGIHTPVLWLASAIAFIPCVILGSILKGFSYLSPRVRAAHQEAKEKLTARREVITITTRRSCRTELEDLVKSGQKVSTLTIISMMPVISARELTLISQINAEKTVLDGPKSLLPSIPAKPIEKILSSPTNSVKSRKWDCSALPSSGESDASSAPLSNRPRTRVHDTEEVCAYPRPGLYNRIRGIKEHTLFVVDATNVRPLPSKS